jgi:glycosyltransferase involved in cell wall biosynthesis
VGATCIIGVDDNSILKDFVRAHVEHLSGPKVTLSNWYPDLVHEGWTVRHFYSTSPARAKAQKLLPQALYNRLVTSRRDSWEAVHDALAAFFAQHKVDVMLAEFGPAGADIAPHAKALGIPLLVHFHGHDAHRKSVVDPYRERYRQMFASAEAILSVSRFMTRTLIDLGADPSRVIYNPYGPRDRFFEVTPTYERTVLALGRFTDIKANYLTLAAFAKALLSVPDARMVMAGEGELLETCKTLASTWGISDRVSFPGAIPHADAVKLFVNACCFAQHSVTPSYGDAEGTPVAILEAGAAGLPVIATKHAGIPDVVIDNESGFLVDERDVRAQAEHMVRLLRDPELCRAMGARARKHIRTHFSMKHHIGRLQQAVDVARARQRA